jgi:hypothetical protein
MKPKESDGIKNVLVGIFVTLLVAMFLTIACWILYAYRNPNSASGIWLIEVNFKILLNLI